MVGGFVGGFLFTAALGAVIFVVLLQKMKLAHKNLFDLILVSSLLMYFHTELKWMHLTHHVKLQVKIKAVFPLVPTLPMATWKE